MEVFGAPAPNSGNGSGVIARPTRSGSRMLDAVEIIAAGKPIPDAGALIRQYCGVNRQGPAGRAQVWAYRYFDAKPSSPRDVVTDHDVVAAAAFGTSLNRETLEWFHFSQSGMSEFVSEIPADLDLEDATDADLDALDWMALGVLEGIGPWRCTGDMACDPRGPMFPLITRVLHRKRPSVIPIYDRSIARRYEYLTGRSDAAAWPRLVRAIRSDLQRPETGSALRAIQRGLADDLRSFTVPSRLRLLDIAVWMDENRRRRPTKGAA